MQMRNSTLSFLVACLLLSNSPAWSQFGKSAFVTRDPRVDVLVDKQIELNGEAIKGRTITIQGFRLLMITTNKRDVALDIKSRLMKNYPDQKSYLYYQSPNFKVQFGNFKTYKDADKAKSEMEAFFGKDMIIVPSKIEMRAEKELDDNQ
ncbi:MAG: hypothetical protein RLZZ204_124 [Bacteroidota bacterium]|jgi:hypothetical protein